MIQSPPTASDISQAIRTIPDFPKTGIQFKDITPVLADARLFSGSIDLLTDGLKPSDVDAVVGIDAKIEQARRVSARAAESHQSRTRAGRLVTEILRPWIVPAPMLVTTRG